LTNDSRTSRMARDNATKAMRVELGAQFQNSETVQIFRISFRMV